ncbi:DEAD/DEAH box helicase [Verrucomicrobiota bacterium sgz303538]
MQKKPFPELGVSPEILKAVERMGFEEASPIQSAAIPVLLSGRDAVGQSQTGSGKTAAFAIPAIEKIDPTLKAPQALVLCPTRELAMQVAEEVAKLSAFKRGVRELPIYGGQSYERQFRGLQAGAQIIIGTPGRVIDHLDRGTLKLDQIRMVILDECDRMLDMGFSEDIQRILESAPAERQTVFFSATLPRPIQNMIQRFARDPELIKIEAQQVDAPTIEQVYYEVGYRSKLEVLCRLIDVHDFKFGIIFCATKMGVDELTEHLTARGYAADRLHGDMAQTMRERVMRRFRERKIEFLVATDVAARGIDVNDVEVVFNYDLPQDPEDYVHRIGRTGRAGRSGRAISFVAGREIYKMQQIMRYTKGRIRREVVPTLDVVEEKRAEALISQLRETLEKAEFKKQDEVIDRLLEEGHTSTDISSALLHLLASEQTRPAERIPEDMPKEARREYPKYAPRAIGGGEEGSTEAGARQPSVTAPQRARPGAREGGDFPWSEELGERSRRAPRSEEGRAPRGRGIGREEELSRVSHEAGMTRIALNTGREHGIMPGDVVGVIAGVTGLPREVIGAIKLLPRQTLVDVAEDHADDILRKLKGIKFKGHKLSALRATDVAGEIGGGGGARGERRPPASRTGFGRPTSRPTTSRRSRE